MQTLKPFLLAIALASAALVTSAPASAAAAAAGAIAGCKGQIFNPLSDTDWNNMYPIVTAGIPAGPTYPQSPLHFMPPVCVCPGIFGIPSPGIGVTYWEPLYISEIERTAGCLASVGGVPALPAFSSLSSEQGSAANPGNDNTNRMQVHWYEYPVFSMLDVFTSTGCNNRGGFTLTMVTEVDPTWQNDLWGVVFSPEGALFGNPIAQAACAIDAATSTAGYPLDPLFWCAGTWGSIYPFTGNSPHGNSNFTLNNLVQAKYIARQHRVGMLFQSIGPTAMCWTHPNPIWMKSQYRVNQVGPIPRYGMPVQIGNPGKMQVPPFSNVPTKESTVNLIWQGKQCCMKSY